MAIETPGLDRIVPLAQKNLPEKVSLSPKLYFVMGGRAGAAASDDGIYVDLLRDSESPQEIVQFFAHETHHLGYGQILDRKKRGPGQTWDFLSNVLMEGSATLLINAHGKWSELESADHIKPDLARLPELLPKMQDLLRRALAAKMEDQDFQTGESDFFGEGYHAVGAKLLFTIERAHGRAAVLRVMDNPATLLRIYNESARRVHEPFRFDPALAAALGTSFHGTTMRTLPDCNLLQTGWMPVK